GPLPRGGDRRRAVPAARAVADRSRLADARVHAQRGQRQDAAEPSSEVSRRPGAEPSSRHAADLGNGARGAARCPVPAPGSPPLPLWGAGSVALLVARALRPYRALASAWITVALILIVNRTSRSSYLVPAYPALMAAGAVMIERWRTTRRARTRAIAILVAAAA